MLATAQPAPQYVIHLMPGTATVALTELILAQDGRRTMSAPGPAARSR